MCELKTVAMAKYQIEQKYILGNFRKISSFLKL